MVGLRAEEDPGDGAAGRFRLELEEEKKDVVTTNLFNPYLLQSVRLVGICKDCAGCPLESR